MARRRSSADSSLELLLDTICNTFGGVLFLAMLVSLMLTQTRRKTDASPADPAPAVSAAELVRLETRADDATRTVEALEAQVRQARRVAGDLAVPDADAQLAAMEAAELRATEAEARRAELLATLAAEQAASARAQAARSTDEREQRRLAAEAERARQRLADAVDERERLVASGVRVRDDAARRETIHSTGGTPRARLPTKNQFPLMVRYGRLYLMKKLRGGELVVNEDDFTLTPGLLLNVAKAKPHAGIDLGVVEGRDAALRRITADFPPSDWYAILVVHPDSFEEYITAKNWLVERGYNFMPLPTDDVVTDAGRAEDQRMQ